MLRQPQGPRLLLSHCSSTPRPWPSSPGARTANQQPCSSPWEEGQVRKGSGLDSPVAVTIFFGANDSALKGTGACVSLVHLSLFSVKANLSFYTFFKCFCYLPGGSFAKLKMGSPSLLPFISSFFSLPTSQRPGSLADLQFLRFDVFGAHLCCTWFLRSLFS